MKAIMGIGAVAVSAALFAAAPTMAAPTVAGAAATQTTVIRPVDGAGHAAPGWTVDTANAYRSADGCSRASTHAISAGIYDCGATALDGDACWPTDNGADLLCLTDPFSTTVEMYRTGGRISQGPPPAHPVPIGLLLDDGSRCRARVGGSWGRPTARPDYFGYFSCSRSGRSAGSVWGPPDGSEGITENPGGWTVQQGPADGPLTTRAVTEAYFVGTA